jgi:hypothetical protein
MKPQSQSIFFKKHHSTLSNFIAHVPYFPTFYRQRRTLPKKRYTEEKKRPRQSAVHSLQRRMVGWQEKKGPQPVKTSFSGSAVSFFVFSRFLVFFLFCLFCFQSENWFFKKRQIWKKKIQTNFKSEFFNLNKFRIWTNFEFEQLSNWINFQIGSIFRSE